MYQACDNGGPSMNIKSVARREETARVPMVPHSLERLQQAVGAVHDAINRLESRFSGILCKCPESGEKNACHGKVGQPASDVAVSLMLRCEELEGARMRLDIMMDNADL